MESVLHTAVTLGLVLAAFDFQGLAGVARRAKSCLGRHDWTRTTASGDL